jgi:hypothetical protein
MLLAIGEPAEVVNPPRTVALQSTDDGRRLGLDRLFRVLSG